MFRNQQVEGIGFVVSQSAGVHIRLIIHFLEGFLDLVACRFRHVWTVVQNSVYGSNGYASSLGNILDSDFSAIVFSITGLVASRVLNYIRSLSWGLR